MKVIGAGFGRMGTMSLKVALEMLGIGPCLHMVDVLSNPALRRAFQQAHAGVPTDWPTVCADFSATIDWPGCTFYKELMVAYPDAKVLLNVRNPEAWYASVQRTIYGIPHSFPYTLLRYISPRYYGNRKLTDSVIWNGTFGGRFLDKQHTLAVWERHVADVKRHVPAERLLVYDVKEGWEPLCRFLGVPVPQGRPFPRLNDAEKFRLRVQSEMLKTAGKIALGVGLLGAAALLVHRQLRRH